jgi:hypothetical protein
LPEAKSSNGTVASREAVSALPTLSTWIRSFQICSASTLEGSVSADLVPSAVRIEPPVSLSSVWSCCEYQPECR